MGLMSVMCQRQTWEQTGDCDEKLIADVALSHQFGFLIYIKALPPHFTSVGDRSPAIRLDIGTAIAGQLARREHEST